jgi:hypothetical protein
MTRDAVLYELNKKVNAKTEGLEVIVWLSDSIKAYSVLDVKEYNIIIY